MNAEESGLCLEIFPPYSDKLNVSSSMSRTIFVLVPDSCVNGLNQIIHWL